MRVRLSVSPKGKKEALLSRAPPCRSGGRLDRLDEDSHKAITRGAAERVGFATAWTTVPTALPLLLPTAEPAVVTMLPLPTSAKTLGLTQDRSPENQRLNTRTN